MSGLVAELAAFATPRGAADDAFETAPTAGEAAVGRDVCVAFEMVAARAGAVFAAVRAAGEVLREEEADF